MQNLSSLGYSEQVLLSRVLMEPLPHPTQGTRLQSGSFEQQINILPVVLGLPKLFI